MKFVVVWNEIIKILNYLPVCVCVCVRDQVHYRSSSIFQLFKKKSSFVYNPKAKFFDKKKRAALFILKGGFDQDGVWWHFNNSWSISHRLEGRPLAFKSNKHTLHTHRQYIQTAPSVCSSSRVSRIFPSRKEQTIGIRPQMTLFF